jgi:hypothetical protein
MPNTCILKCNVKDRDYLNDLPGFEHAYEYHDAIDPSEWGRIKTDKIIFRIFLVGDPILMNEWIKVEDRLPKHNQMIRIKSDNLWLGEGIFQDGKFVYSWVKGACFGEATHWAPLEIPKKSEWIKVEDRLPKDDCDVLVYHAKDDHITVGCFDKDNRSYYIESDGSKFYIDDGWETEIPWAQKGRVTHWRPLPEKPNE